MKKSAPHFSAAPAFLALAFLCLQISWSGPNADKQGLVLLDRSKAALKADKVEEMKTALLRLLNKYPESSSREEALVLLSSAYLLGGRADSAMAIIARFQAEFPESPYDSRMYYYEGLVHLNSGQFYDAAQMFVSVVNRTGSPELFGKSKSQISKLAAGNVFNEDELQNIIHSLKYDRELLSELLISLGDLQMRNRRFKAAVITWEMWLHYFKKEKNGGSVREKLKQAQKNSTLTRTILIMVPLSGIDAEVGRILLEGMLLALDTVISSSGGRLNYEVIDTRGDPILAVNRLRRAMQEEEVLCVLGPVLSDVATAVAIELSSRQSPVPMITPTATTRGISALGKGIFQMNVTTSVLAGAISDYATGCLKLREFAIMAPNTEYGIDLAAAFEARAARNGGSVIAKEFYDPEAKDYAGHYQVIRRRKAKSEIDKTWPVSVAKNKYNYDKLVASWAADSVLTLDGIFIAATNVDEALKVSSQARYNKLNSSILGASGWYDRQLFHMGGPGAAGTVISSGYYLDDKSPEWASFKQKYKSKWGGQPGIVPALGYNAAFFLIQGLESGGDKNLLATLRKVKSFSGAFGKVEMDHAERFNRSAVLLKVGTRDFERIEGCGEEKKGPAPVKKK